MHDSQIISYSVDFTSKMLIMKTYLGKTGECFSVEMQEVLTHFFDQILENNILLDIVEKDIDCFIAENLEALTEKKNYGWPFFYEDINALKQYLLNNGYKYIVLYSSFGLCGWVLAKQIRVLVEESHQ